MGTVVHPAAGRKEASGYWSASGNELDDAEPSPVVAVAAAAAAAVGGGDVVAAVAVVAVVVVVVVVGWPTAVSISVASVTEVAAVAAVAAAAVWDFRCGSLNTSYWSLDIPV